MRAVAWAALLGAGLLSGCWAWAPPSFEELAQRAWLDHPGAGTLQAWAREAQALGPSKDPLVAPEGALGPLRLGASAEDLRRHLGAPTEGGAARAGARWVWRHEGSGPVVAELGGSPAVAVRLEAWAPQEASTRSLIRPGDDAARVVRKFGAAPWRKAWGLRGCELWVVPKANAAFVVGPVRWDRGEALPRRVLALMVGGFGG